MHNMIVRLYFMKLNGGIAPTSEQMIALQANYEAIYKLNTIFDRNMGNLHIGKVSVEEYMKVNGMKEVIN